MPDGPFKSMTPDPEGKMERKYGWTRLRLRPFERCERCGGAYFEGDWPFCKGNPKDHMRTEVTLNA